MPYDTVICIFPENVKSHLVKRIAERKLQIVGLLTVCDFCLFCGGALTSKIKCDICVNTESHASIMSIFAETW